MKKIGGLQSFSERSAGRWRKDKIRFKIADRVVTTQKWLLKCIFLKCWFLYEKKLQNTMFKALVEADEDLPLVELKQESADSIEMIFGRRCSA